MKYIPRLVAFCTLFTAACLCANAQENTVQSDCTSSKLANLSMQIMLSRAKTQIALTNLVDACKAWQKINSDDPLSYQKPLSDDVRQEVLNALKNLISILEQARGPLTQCLINDPKILDRIVSQSALNEVVATPDTNAIIRMARGFVAGLIEPTTGLWKDIHGTKGVLEVSWGFIKEIPSFPSLLLQSLLTPDALFAFSIAILVWVGIGLMPLIFAILSPLTALYGSYLGLIGEIGDKKTLTDEQVKEFNELIAKAKNAEASILAHVQFQNVCPKLQP